MLGRGRWKIGFPRSGMTVRGGVGFAGRCGAAYTGRGPVCGTISRRAGGAGRAGAAGFAAAGGAVTGAATVVAASAGAEGARLTGGCEGASIGCGATSATVS